MHFQVALANPCENTIWETLLKVCLLLAPPRPLRSDRSRRRTCLLSLVILNVFTPWLFIITILKPMVCTGFLSFVCPKCFIIQVCQPTYEEIQLHNVSRAQDPKIVCYLPDFNLFPHILLFQSRKDRISASLIQLSLKTSTLAKGRRKRTSLAIERNSTDSRLIVLLSPPR